MASQSYHNNLVVKESLKDDHLNNILDKIKVGIGLSESEMNFIKEYDHMIESDLKDLSHLSKNQVFEKVCYYLERDKTVICDLYDRDGRIDDKILSISNLFEEDCCILNLKHGDSVKIYDRFLYKITYNLKRYYYCLETQGEYYEKIIKENED